MTHICVNKITVIGSDNGLSPGRQQAIIWTNAGILLIWLLETNFNEILIEIDTFSLKEIHLKMSSVKWRPSCRLGLNVLSRLRAWLPWATRNCMGAVIYPVTDCAKRSLKITHFLVCSLIFCLIYDYGNVLIGEGKMNSADVLTIGQQDFSKRC